MSSHLHIEPIRHRSYIIIQISRAGHVGRMDDHVPKGREEETVKEPEMDRTCIVRYRKEMFTQIENNITFENMKSIKHVNKPNGLQFDNRIDSSSSLN